MAATSNSKPVSPLAEYLIDVLYHRWSSDRQDLEKKWEQNDNTIRRIRQIDWKQGEGDDWRANNAIGFVKQKWLTGVALVLDHVLEGGNLNAGLKVEELGRDLSPEELESYTDSVDQATKHLRTQFALGRIDRSTIKAVMSAGKYGLAWGHYYVDTINRAEWVPVQYDFPPEDPNDQRYERVTSQIDIPMVEWVPVWEMFWDMTVDDIEKGDGLCREQNITAYKLREYAQRGEGWLPQEVESVIEDAKTNERKGEEDDNNIAPGRRFLEYSKNVIKMREFRCRVPKKVLMAYKEKYVNERALDSDGGFAIDLAETDGNEQECLVVVANNIVVRYLPITDSAENRKYYLVKWEDDLDHEHGVGIADNGYQVQEILNGAFNAFQDNKKLAGDVQGFYNPLHFKNSDDMSIQPGKFRPTTEAIKNINEAVMQLQFADTGTAYLDMIRLVQEFLDDETYIPKMAQGAAGAVTPNTAYEASQMMEKSGKYIAGVITNFDNGWTEPITRDYFEYNMMDPANTTGKGNFVAVANGFTSYQDKVIRVQKLMQVMTMVLGNPTLESMVRVMRLMEELLRANDIDPDEILYSQEEYEANRNALMQAQMPPQEDEEITELQKEKVSAEIDQIEREQNRKDQQLEFEQRKFLVEKRREAVNDIREDMKESEERK